MKTVLIYLIGLSIIIPYIYTTIFQTAISFLWFFPICGFSLLGLVIFLTVYFIVSHDTRKKIVITFISLAAVSIFLFTRHYQMQTANNLYFKYRETELTKLISELSSFKEIHSLRVNEKASQYLDKYTKFKEEASESYNGSLDTTATPEEKIIYIQKFELIEKGLSDTGVYSFITLDDETYLTIEGWVIGESGYVYCEDVQPPCYAKVWNRVGDKWFWFYK
ncbi:MAG: hypothetical protein EHM58_07260 [Ignavibacteriae bacterium]|nr:MAG: hypothetical protein EHM58_07260 [Ignavibacteriota bacterium]